MAIADHNAELRKYTPKPINTIKQNTRIAWFTRLVQKRFDLKIKKATTVYHTKSQSQWITAKTINGHKPKLLAVITSVVPIVNHHNMKPALAAVVQIPAISDSCFGLSYSSLALFLFLNI